MASGFQSAGDDPDFEDDNDDFTLGPTPKPTPPPAKQYTNGLFKPLTKRQEDMLNQEYYNKKNMVGLPARPGWRDRPPYILQAAASAAELLELDGSMTR